MEIYYYYMRIHIYIILVYIERPRKFYSAPQPLPTISYSFPHSLKLPLNTFAQQHCGIKHFVQLLAFHFYPLMPSAEAAATPAGSLVGWLPHSYIYTWMELCILSYYHYIVRRQSVVAARDTDKCANVARYVAIHIFYIENNNT